MKTVGMRIAFLRPLRAQRSAPKLCRQEWRHGTQECVHHVGAALAESSYCRSLAQIASIKDGGFMGSLDIRTPTAA